MTFVETSGDVPNSDTKMATVVLDNGAYSAKIGYSKDAQPLSCLNCVIKAKNVRNRIFIADQIDDCKDLSGLFYLLPFQKGYLVNWDIERQVWDHFFGKHRLKVNYDSSSVIITEPCFDFMSIQEATNEVMFEDYQYDAIFRCNAGFLSQYKHNKATENKQKLCCLVVESGYSFTHIIPYCNGKKIKDAVCRVNVGGKVLTNHLKEVISYRQLMVMDETYVMNQMKEDVCYVSTDFWGDLEISRKRSGNTVVREYVLPDYTHIKRGHIKDTEEKAKGSEQIIRMNNERFAVPEVLFHPSDIGINEMGIAEAILHCVSKTPKEMHPHLYGNVVITGGNGQLPGFRDRLYTDVRASIPDEYELNITLPDNPSTHPWQGGALLAKDPAYKKMCVTRQEYEEHGHNITLEKFDV